MITSDAQPDMNATANAKPSATQAAELFTLLYTELCRLARREVWRNGARDYLSTRTVVHEAWMEVSQREAVNFDDPRKFLGYAARMMRGLVIDRVRAKHSQKRGGEFAITSLDTHNADEIQEPETLQHIGDALDELATVEPELANVVDLKFFCGFTLTEIATMQGVSERTVRRQWEKARLLLRTTLE